MKYLLFSMLAFSSFSHAYDYKYGEDVGLVGTIGAIYDGKWSNNGGKGAPALRLDTPITVIPSVNGDEFDYVEQGVQTIHLSIGEDSLWSQYRLYKGKAARVVCNLYHSHTIYHKTPVLCSVSSIGPMVYDD